MDWIDQLKASGDAFALFGEWFEEAKKSEPRDPDAMILGTVDEAGLPNQRAVLMRGFGEEGFLFHSNGQSVKGQELHAHPEASLLFHWKSLGRQVRLRGSVTLAEPAAVDAYFASRPYGSQIGAWASAQSESLPAKEILAQKVRETEALYPEGSQVPRPPHWIGYLIQPVEIEFWWEGKFRLHDRVRGRRAGPGQAWRFDRLNP